MLASIKDTIQSHVRVLITWYFCCAKKSNYIRNHFSFIKVWESVCLNCCRSGISVKQLKSHFCQFNGCNKMVHLGGGREGDRKASLKLGSFNSELAPRIYKDFKGRWRGKSSG